jgi:uncharacterized cupin superfamily protein
MRRILTGHVDRAELHPVDYSGITVAGDPRARIARLCTEESGEWMSTVGVFECDPCTLVAPVETDETILVLDGEVRIELDNGTAVDLGPGDIAVLPRGAVATWHVKTWYKEFFVLSGMPTTSRSTDGG